MKNPEAKKNTAGRDSKGKDTLSIPTWLLEENTYIPSKKKDSFLKNSHLKLLAMTSSIRNAPASTCHPLAESVFPIIFVIYCILLASIAENMFFVYCLIAVLLLRCCLLQTKQLQQVMTSALSAGFFSMIVLLPAVFLGSPETLLRISVKVFFSVGLLRLLAVTIPWNKLTKTLAKLHVPALFILTLDLTIFYIVILGNICLHMLEAISLRAVGKWPKNTEKALKNIGKQKAFAGVAATALLRSRQMAEETHMAMICRGFDGQYKRDTTTFHTSDPSTRSKKSIFLLPLCFLIVMSMLAIAFLYLEGVVFP